MTTNMDLLSKLREAESDIAIMLRLGLPRGMLVAPDPDKPEENRNLFLDFVCPVRSPVCSAQRELVCVVCARPALDGKIPRNFLRDGLNHCLPRDGPGAYSTTN